MKLLRRSAARLARWWWGDPSPVGVVGRVLLLVGVTIAVHMSDGPRALGYAIWALGIALVYLDDRRRRLADAGDDLVVDRGGDR